MIVALALPFGLLWRDYAVALVNAQTAGLGADYLWGEWPIALDLLAGVLVIRRLRLPLWWLAFPPLVVATVQVETPRAVMCQDPRGSVIRRSSSRGASC